jgi:hypothetical protein
MTCNSGEVSSTKSFALSLAALNPTDRYYQQRTQFKTLDTVNSRTCCTKNWVRSFDTTNGGGHKWVANKLQTIDKKNFKTLNWAPNNDADGTNPTPFQCTIAGYPNLSCEMRNFSPSETDLYLKFFGALELAGIPQVALMTEDHVSQQSQDTVGSEGIAQTSPVPPVGTVEMASSSIWDLTKDFLDASTSKKLYSAANTSAFQTGTKKVFSDNEFNCCIPSGQTVPDYTTPDQCCTGFLANEGASKALRCCLDDYTDLTVYLSRYVSSEGRGLPDSAYDPNTGYIKDPGIVETIATQKLLCCSGKMTTGVAIRKLPIPIDNGTWLNDPAAWTNRFVYLSSAVDNNNEFGPIGEVFDKGVRWNNHVYCIPKDLAVYPAK